MPIKIAFTTNVYTGILQYLLLYLYNVQFVVTEKKICEIRCIDPYFIFICSEVLAVQISCSILHY